MRDCIWCGGRANSNEHLIPVWIRDLLSRQSPSIDEYEITFEVASPLGSEQRWGYGAEKLELKVKIVCQDCNNGWMASLEQSTQPVLKALILGATTHVPPEQLSTLAHWAAKTAVLMEGLGGASVVLSPGDREVIQTEGAPAGFMIRLGYRDVLGDDPARILTSTVAASPLGQALAAEPNAFNVTVALGHVVVAVAGGPALEDPTRWSREPTASLSVWPPAPLGIQWPPVLPRLSSARDVRLFHEQMWARIANSEFPRPGSRGE